jgi:hypothetical protein
MWKWPYALEYLCYLKHIASIVEFLNPKTLLDVGCGDGRFIEEISHLTKAQGCDLDSNATRWAQGAVSTTDAALIKRPFEMVTAIEVLEHIPEDEIDKFIYTLRERAFRYVLICVPTTVYPLSAKHYRHYDEALLLAHTSQLGKPIAMERVVAKRWWWDALNAIPSERLTPWLWDKLWNKLRVATLRDGRHLVGVWKV